jgi:hypothetical protein
MFRTAALTACAPNVLVRIARPTLEPRECRVWIRAEQLVADGEGPEVAAYVLVVDRQRRLDEVQKRLRPVRMPRARGVLRGDDDRPAQPRIPRRHPGARGPEVLVERALQRIAEERRRGLADLPVVVAREAMDRPFEVRLVRRDERPEDDGRELLVDTSRVLEQPGRPVAADERRGALLANDRGGP